MEIIYRMVFTTNISYVTNRIDTQVTHPFFYTTRKENNKIIKKSFFKNSLIKINEKKLFNNKKKNKFLFLFSNQTYTLGCVTCVWIIGGFLL